MFALPATRSRLMKTLLVMLALLLSSVSLALQLKKPKPAPTLEKFLVPAAELNLRMVIANQEMIRGSLAMRDGMGVPYIRRFTDDNQHIIVWVLVREEDLPKLYDERKKVLSDTAMSAFTWVASAFDLKFEDHSTSEIVIVQFISIRDLASDNNKVYAEFKNGE